MARYVVTIHLPDFFDEEFMALIPAHRAMVNELLKAGTLEVYAISASRSRGWITLPGESVAGVRSVVEQLPLYRYFRQIEIDELFVFDNAAAHFPRISLN